MLAPKSTFQPETVALMGRVFDAVWREIQAKYFLPSDNTNEIGVFVARRIIAAAAGGERDPERLKATALQALDA